MNVTLAGVQFLTEKDAVLYTVVGPDPINLKLIKSTEADIRSAMVVPVENWGNADALVDCQAKVTEQYPGWGFTVVLPEVAE